MTIRNTAFHYKNEMMAIESFIYNIMVNTNTAFYYKCSYSIFSLSKHMYSIKLTKPSILYP